MQTLYSLVYFDSRLLGRVLSPGDGFVAVPDQCQGSIENNRYNASIWTGNPDDLVWDDKGCNSYSPENREASWQTRMIIDCIPVGKSNPAQYFEIGKAGLYDQRIYEEIKQPNVTIFRMKKKVEE